MVLSRQLPKLILDLIYINRSEWLLRSRRGHELLIQTKFSAMPSLLTITVPSVFSTVHSNRTCRLALLGFCWLCSASADECISICWPSRASQGRCDSAPLVAASFLDLTKESGLALRLPQWCELPKVDWAFPFWKDIPCLPKLSVPKGALRQLTQMPLYSTFCHLACVFLYAPLLIHWITHLASRSLSSTSRFCTQPMGWLLVTQGFLAIPHGPQQVVP